MDIFSLGVVLTGFLVFSLISGRLCGTVITAPLVFIAFGLLIGPGGTEIAQIDPGHGGIHLIAECTLILVLFADAARIDLRQVRKDYRLPGRMLLLGLPLTLMLGMLIAVWMFPHFSFWEAAVLAALLAPTDAALGQAVVTAKVVPARIRQAINVESGLNDGLALPAVLLLASLAGAVQSEAIETGYWIQFVSLQIILGPLIGIVGGIAGAAALDKSIDLGWMIKSYQGIAILALAILLYVLAEYVGGNGFIAVFVGGMLFGQRLKHPCDFLLEFMETEGQLLMLITFLVFGAVMLPEALAHAELIHFVYALLSLTLIRMLPVFLSLTATGIGQSTKLFLGWFGPRGIASVLFLLLVLDDFELAQQSEIYTITVITVALSALLHGLSAAPLSKLYGRLASGMGQCAENMPAVELPLREGNMNQDNNN